LKVPEGWRGFQISNKVVSPAAFNPRIYSWYSFLLKAEGHRAAGRIMSIKNPKDTIQKSESPAEGYSH